MEKDGNFTPSFKNSSFIVKIQNSFAEAGEKNFFYYPLWSGKNWRREGCGAWASVEFWHLTVTIVLCFQSRGLWWLLWSVAIQCLCICSHDREALDHCFSSVLWDALLKGLEWVMMGIVLMTAEHASFTEPIRDPVLSHVNQSFHLGFIWGNWVCVWLQPPSFLFVLLNTCYQGRLSHWVKIGLSQNRIHDYNDVKFILNKEERKNKNKNKLSKKLKTKTK